jgi:hypothetical protein
MDPRFSLAALVPVLAALAAPLPSQAEEPPLSPEAFEALTTGRTLFWRSETGAYGAEQYLPGRRVIWALTGDDCLKGEWFADGALICFRYEDAPGDPHCWLFRQTPGGLSARSSSDPLGPPLTATEGSPEPLACLGPDVGV